MLTRVTAVAVRPPTGEDTAMLVEQLSHNARKTGYTLRRRQISTE
jgi:hypothetical protein